MKKTIRTVAVLLCMVLLLGACANTTTTTTTTAPASATTQPSADSTETAAPSEGTEATAIPEEDTGNFNPTGYPIVKEKITLTGFGNQNVTHKDWSEVWCFTSYEEISNIHIEWETAPNSGFAEAKSILLASGDYPDIFYRCNLSVSELVQYGEMGVFAVLNDYIDQYATNLLAVFEIETSARRELTMADGNIYSMPMISGSTASSSGRGWINARWLENVGMEVPTTIDEMEEVLTAFKEQDANGNGDPSDELVYSDRQSGNTLLQWTRPTFGMGNLGATAADDYHVDSAVDGELRFFANTDDYKAQLTWISGLYAAGLIDKEIFSQDITTFTSKGAQDLIGSFWQNDNPQIIGALKDEFVFMQPLKNVDDGLVYCYNRKAVVTPGVFAVNASSDYIREAVRWCDYWYGEDGQIRIRIGLEGVTYEVEEDGSFKCTDYVMNNPDGLTAAQAIGQYALGFAGGGCPEYVTTRIEVARLPAVAFEAADIERTFPVQLKNLVALRFTPEEQDELNALLTDITTYVSESAVSFITGSMSLENDWQTYCETLEQMGLEHYMQILNAAYDRWLAL